MTQVPRRLVAMLNRPLLVELLAPSYATARNVDPNEAARRLDDAVRQVRLLEGIQRGTWAALRAARPAQGDDAILDAVQKKLARTKRWQPFRPRASEDGGFAAVVVLIDVGAHVAGGDAWDLLESREGGALLERGFEALGRHLAKELLR